MRLKLELEVAPPFLPLVNKKCRYKVFYGGRGSGKSWTFARVLLTFAAMRKIRVLCARELQVSIADSVHKLLCDQIAALGLETLFTITKTGITGNNGSEFIFKGLHHNVTEIKSMEGIDYVWVEEAQSVSRESWDLLIPTIRNEGSEIWVSFNPFRPDDETYRRFVLEPPAGALVVKVGWEDNPWFPSTLYEEMERCRDADPDAYAHIWGGEPRVISDAQIFRGRYDIMAFETPENVRFFHGVDWGFANDPTALIRMYVTDGILYVDQEAYGTGIELDELPELFRTIPTTRNWPIKADSARPETISYMARKGFHITGAKKWAGSVQDGIALLKSFTRIVVHPRCVHTADEMRLYSYKVDRINGDILPIPEDAWNHCIAGGELVTTRRGDIPVEQVRVGDEVFTRDGWHVVTASRQTGIREVVTVTTAHASIRCTADHKVFTANRGFVEAGDLRKGDVLCLLQKCFHTTDWNGEDTRIPAAEVIASTTSAHASINRSGFTATFGKSSMEQSRMVFTSITRTKTRRTTISGIWNAFRQGFISSGTRTRRSVWKNRLCTSPASGILQKIGTAAQKAVKYIDALENWLTKTLFPKPITVCNAAQSSSAASLGTGTNSAPMPVSQNTAGNREWTTSSGIANGAGMSSRRTNTQSGAFAPECVLFITPPSSEKVAVYDLTVEGSHEFFVNGILVHNCVDAMRYALDGYVHRSVLNINPAAVAPRLGLRI